MKRAAADRLYVSPLGRPGNDGHTPDAPLGSVQAALDRATPGMTILLRGGTYDEIVATSASGSAARGWITLANYPGEHPVLSGARWLGSGDRSKDVLMTVTDARYLRIVGLSFSTLRSVTYDGALLFVHGSGDHIVIRHCTFSDTRPLYGRAISVTGDDPQPLRHLTIEGNTVHHVNAWNGEALTLSGNIAGFAILDNIVTAGNGIAIDMKGGYPDGSAAGAFNYVRSGIVLGNEVYANVGDGKTSDAPEGHPDYTNIGAGAGIYVDGGRDIVVEHNHVYANDVGIVLGSELKGATTARVTARYNVIRHNRFHGAVIGTVPSFCDSSGCGTTSDTVFTNNTLVGDGTTMLFGDPSSILLGAVAGASIHDNIVVASPAGAVLRDVAGRHPGLVLDYNQYFGPQGASTFILDGNTYKGLPALRSRTLFEFNGLEADPRSINPARGDLDPQSGSPARRVGKPTTN